MFFKSLPILESFKFVIFIFQRSWFLFFVIFFLYIPINVIRLYIFSQIIDDVSLLVLNYSEIISNNQILFSFGLFLLILVLNFIIKKTALLWYDNADFKGSIFYEFLILIKYSIVEFIVSTAVSLGFFLFIIPGFYFLTFFGFSAIDIIYRNSNIIDSFKKSIEISRPFIFGLLSFNLIVIFLTVLIGKYCFYFALSSYLKSLISIFSMVMQLFFYRYAIEYSYSIEYD